MILATNGGNDPGAVHFGREEAGITLLIASACRQKLNGLRSPEDKFDFPLVRFSDTSVLSLNARIHLANQLEAEAYISIHCNAAENPDASGIEVLCWQPKDGSPPMDNPRSNGLAYAVLDSMLVAFPDRKNRGVKGRSNLAVLRDTVCPAIIVECGFLSNREEAEWIVQNVEKIGEAIAMGVWTWLKGE